MDRCLPYLDLVEAEIANDIEETGDGQGKPVLPESLNTEFPGRIQGKKKARTLLKTWTEIIQIDLRASELAGFISGIHAPPCR